MAIETTHLSDLDLERYRSRTMPRARLLESDDHLTACSECSQRLRSAPESSGALDSIETSLFNEAERKTEHLSFEQMASVVDGESAQSDRELFRDHLASCPECSEEVRDLYQDKAAISGRRAYAPGASSHILESQRRGGGRKASSQRHPGIGEKYSNIWKTAGFRWAIQAAAVAVIVLLAVWWVDSRLGSRVAGLQSRVAELQKEKQTLESRQQEIDGLKNELAAALKENEALKQGAAGESQLVAALNDSGGQITLDRSGRLSGLDFLSSSNQADVKAALKSARIKLPADLASLRGESGTLLGTPGSKTPYGLVGPVGMVVRSNRPRFYWREVPGATSYELTIYSDGFKKFAESGPQPETTWTPATPLQRGQVYTWQVVTAVDGKQVVLPPAAAPRARFKVLNEPALDDLEQVERAGDKSHLALGIVYAKHGLLNDARREFQALVAANPDSALVKSLLRSVVGTSEAGRGQ